MDILQNRLQADCVQQAKFPDGLTNFRSAVYTFLIHRDHLRLLVATAPMD